MILLFLECIVLLSLQIFLKAHFHSLPFLGLQLHICRIFVTVPQLILLFYFFFSLFFSLYDDIPYFSKACVTPLCFYERPTSVPSVLVLRDIRRGFSLLPKKRQKAKIVFSVCFAVSYYRGNMHPKQRE